MERSQTLGFILIFVVLMAWLWLNTPPPEPPQPSSPTAAQQDSAASTQPSKIGENRPESTEFSDSVGRY